MIKQVLSLMLSFVFSLSAFAQCDERWLPPITGSVGFNSNIDDMMEWTSPQGVSYLVVCGGFNSIDGVSFPGVAAWNGSQWVHLGSGLSKNWVGFQSNLAVYQGNLILFDRYMNVDGQACVASLFDGVSWRCIQTQPASFTGGFSRFKNCVHDGSLYVANISFGSPSVLTHSTISRWDGASWETLPDYNPTFSVVSFLGSYGSFLLAGSDMFGKVYLWNGSSWAAISPQFTASTVFTSECIKYQDWFLISNGSIVKRWDGVTWSQMGASLPVAVAKFIIYHNVLYVCGVSSNGFGLYAWEGQWVPVAAGANDRITGAACYADCLFIGGVFTRVGSIESRHVARWHDASSCVADFNCSYSITIDDLFLFLNAWFSGLPSADSNGTMGVTIDDIFFFLNSWFEGC